MSEFDDGSAESTGQIELYAGDDAQAAPETSRPVWQRPIVLAATALALGAAAFLWWPRATPSDALLAVAPDQVAAARTALASAGIPAGFRDGALWVAPADARRAAAALAQDRQQPNALAGAIAEESVFASSDATRARRQAAVMQSLEAAIRQQPGVARAQVVIADAPRGAAPGSQAGGSAAVTVAMRVGAMPQDLVDAVATLVAGACPGIRAEQVAIVDSAAGRVRHPRGADARAAADAVRTREEQAAATVASVLADVVDAHVEVHESPSGGVVATVELPRAWAVARAEAEQGGDLDAFAARQRDRIRAQVEPFLACPSGPCPVVVAVRIAPEAVAGPAYEASVPDAGYSGRSAAQVAVADAAARERRTPLGPTMVGESPVPVAWWIAGAAAVAVAAWFAWRRPWMRGAVGSGLAEGAAVDGDADAPGADEAAAEAAELVRRNPAAAAAIVAGWVDGGFESRAAHLVVVLDSDAAALLLGALSVDVVRRVTDALGELDTPGTAELADASEGFLEEFEVSREGGAYRGGSEAA